MNKIKTKLDIIYNNSVKHDIIILHIADIHFNSNISNKILNRLRDYINKIKADYIMITGDLIDEPKIVNDKIKIRELVTFLSDIAKNSKVIISLGNHDIVNDKDYIFFNKLDDLYNIYVLDNNSYEDDFIYVSGFTLPTEYYYNINGDESVSVLLRELNKNSNIVNRLPKYKPKVAMIHSPIKLLDNEVINTLKEFDLILCGHTHGGMVPDWLGFIFKNMGIIAPNKRLFPKVARGKIEKDIGNKKTTIIINSAVTKLSLKSGKIFSKLNFLCNKSINKIIIRKGREKKYE